VDCTAYRTFLVGAYFAVSICGLVTFSYQSLLSFSDDVIRIVNNEKFFLIVIKNEENGRIWI